MTKRITAIDIMQGIAMLLVVVGHHFFPFMPE
jgi:fucose 4-O-acetylase-like acetyltransferase